jgi:hypothetical protein
MSRILPWFHLLAADAALVFFVSVHRSSCKNREIDASKVFTLRHQSEHFGKVRPTN